MAGITTGCIRLARSLASLVLTGALLHAEAALGCEAMIGTEYADPPEVMTIELDPEEWHTVFRSRSAGVASKEWVRPDKTRRTWTELVNWRVNMSSKPTPLEYVKDSFLRTVKFFCPELESEVAFKSENELVFEWWHGDCSERKAQYHLSRVVNATTGTHHLSYSRKGPAPKEAERKEWLTRIRDAQLDLRQLSDEEESPLHQARLHIWKRDFARAHELLGPLATKGSAEAQEELAGLYFEGLGVPENRDEAFKLFEKAAKQGSAPAQYNLGRMYENGWGTTADPSEARKWFLASAEKGHGEAQGRLGVLLTSTPEPDYAAAAKWLQKSADAGHEHALYWIARMHEEGWGRSKDMEAARELYAKLAVAGEPDSQFRLGLFYRDGLGGLEKDPVVAAVWIERAATQGNTEAQELFSKELAPSPEGARLQQTSRAGQ